MVPNPFYKRGPIPAHPPRRSRPQAPANPWLPRLGLFLGTMLVLASLAAAWLQPPRPDPAATAPGPGRAAWWLHPLERNPQLRLPRVRGDLSGVHALPDSTLVWAVGQKGLILHARDGHTWQQQHPLAAVAGTSSPLAGSALPSPIATAHAVDPPAPRAPPSPGDDNIATPVQQTAPAMASREGSDSASTSANLEAMQKQMLAEELKRQAANKLPPRMTPERPTKQPPKPEPAPAIQAPTETRAPVSEPLAAIPADADLVAVHFDDPHNGWAASARGIALVTTDGGGEWRPAPAAKALKERHPLAEQQLRATLDSATRYVAPAIPGMQVHLLASTRADALRLWAVGRDGVILASADSGETWRRQTRPAGDQTEGTYARLPAPWTYLAFLSGVGLLLGAGRQLGQARQQVPPPQAGIAGLFVSDHPLGPGDPDPLGHGQVAQGLASFILNRNTEPGITMAITGSWGSGKSSIMRLLLYRLQEAGFRPAWFNAWHHQQEGRQLASLFNTIRRQAVPPLHTVPAWLIRGSLLWNRGWFYRLLILGVVSLVLLGGFEAARQQAPLESLRQTLLSVITDTRPVVITPASLEKLRKDNVVDDRILAVLERNMLWTGNPQGAGGCRVQDGDCTFASGAQLHASLEERIKPRLLTDEERAALDGAAQHLGTGPKTILAVLLGALVVPLLLGKGLAVYGLKYMDLFKRFLPERGRMEGKEAVGTMETLRTEFALLTEALDGRLVLFIDDLDRCSCQTVREVLELVNYLSSVGQCFIVLGMAMEHVACCIEPKAEDQDRREYALQYLKKLINIEVPVPAMDPDRSREMLERQTGATERPAPPGPWRRWLGWSLVLLGIVAMSWVLPRVWNQFQPRAEPKAFLAEPPAGVSGSSAPSLPGQAKTDKASPGLKVGLEPGGQQAPSSLLALPPALVLAALGLWITRSRWLPWFQDKGFLPALRRALGQADRGDDRPEFGAALVDWHPIIIQGDPTPRGVKRFVNRVRFLAMMEQSQPQAERISDALLVALAALHHAHLPPDGGNNAHALEAMAKTMDWPPDEARLARFGRLMHQLQIR